MPYILNKTFLRLSSSHFPGGASAASSMVRPWVVSYTQRRLYHGRTACTTLCLYNIAFRAARFTVGTVGTPENVGVQETLNKEA